MAADDDAEADSIEPISALTPEEARAAWEYGRSLEEQAEYEREAGIIAVPRQAARHATGAIPEPSGLLPDLSEVPVHTLRLARYEIDQELSRRQRLTELGEDVGYR